MLLDLKYALRQLRNSPGFTAVAVLTLALGIGANTAIFSFFNGVLLRPLPFAEPDRTVLFQSAPGASGNVHNGAIGLFSADFLDLKKHSRALSDVAAYGVGGGTMTSVGAPDVVGVASVSDNFFIVLGSRAFIGRIFTPGDTQSRSGHLAVLSHAYWETKFGGSPDAIGRAIAINGVSFTVVGVMPPDFQFPTTADLFVLTGPVPQSKIGYSPTNLNGRGDFLTSVIGRLQSGVSIDAAQAELAELVRDLPNPNQRVRPVYLVTMRHQTVGQIRPVLMMLLGCVGLVLLIACLNIANLLLARATARRRETGIRLALGANRWQITRQALTESIMLGLLGGAFGILLGHTGTHLLMVIAPADIPRLAAVRTDGAVLGFAFGLSLLTGVAFGLGPAWVMCSSDPGQSLAGSSRGGTTSVESRKLRTALVAIEVAMSMMLLIVAGLLLRSYWRMQAVSWGFEPSHVVSMRVSFTDPRFASPAVIQPIYRRLQERLVTEPGFESAGLGYDRIGNPYASLPFAPEGHVYRNRGEMPLANMHPVSPDYFKTLYIPLVNGRLFTPEDNNKNSHRVVIVDKSLAQRYFPDGQEIGKHILLPSVTGNPTNLEIVGAVGDVKTNGPQEPPGVDIYFPLYQFPSPSVYISVRTQLAPALCVAAVKRTIAEIDPSVPISNVATMDDIVAQPAVGRCFPLILIGAFAGLSIFLAAIGIYAVVSYSVAQRTREIGIRMALGAQAREVIGLILRQGGMPIITGLAVGMAGSILMALAMRKMLFGVAPLDALTFASVPALLAAIATFACWVPARRAARIDPMIALQAE